MMDPPFSRVYPLSTVVCGGTRRRLGGENPGGDGAADAADLHAAAPESGPDSRGDRRDSHACAAAERRSHGSITGTRPPGRSRHSGRNPIRAERLSLVQKVTVENGTRLTVMLA